MRLTEQEITDIKESVETRFGPDAQVLLFGSRVDDSRRGGDIDLFVQTDLDKEAAFDARLQVLVDLHLKWGERKIDLLVSPLIKPDALVRKNVEKEGVLL